MHHPTMHQNDDGVYDATPTYLFDHAELYRSNAREAGLAWFREARYGLGVTYGLHALLGRGEIGQLSDGISASDYWRLADHFNASRFEANEIVEFAIANGMRYLSFPARGCDGFCLFNSQLSDFTSAKAPAGRDLVGEIASVCEYHGIGLCLQYSYNQDWHHPNAPGSKAEKAVLDLDAYLDYVFNQISELLTQYGPIAAIRLDGFDAPLTNNSQDKRCQDLYDLIHHLQPQTLVAYQQGLLGSEDFFSANHCLPSEEDADCGFFFIHGDRPHELYTSLTPDFWGYAAELAGKHLRSKQIWALLEQTAPSQTNLLLNTALMPDGSLDLEDINELLTVGERIEKNGFPLV